jgi:hypothetical protein
MRSAEDMPGGYVVCNANGLCVFLRAGERCRSAAGEGADAGRGAADRGERRAVAGIIGESR